MKKISTIVPVYNEEANVPLMHEALCDVAQKLPDYAWEFIFVNDGSRDGSWQALEQIAAKDSRVQHPPALIPEFVKKWEAGAEVVASIRKSTEKKSPIKDLGSKFFYRLMSMAAPTKLTPNATDFKLIDRKVINELVRFTEHKRMFRGLIEWLGFRTEYIEFVAPERINGTASYSLGKLLALAINSITSNSLLPLKFFAYLGVLTSLVSFVLLIIMLVYNYLLHIPMFSAISFVIVTNTLVLGIVLVSIGLVALYIGQIQVEVINRPLYVIREKLNGEKD